MPADNLLFTAAREGDAAAVAALLDAGADVQGTHVQVRSAH